MLGKDVDSNKPANEVKQTHCQLSPVGLLNVFAVGLSFASALHDMSHGNNIAMAIDIGIMFLNLLAFSVDIQRIRGGGYTRDSLGFWRPDASVNPKNWRK